MNYVYMKFNLVNFLFYVLVSARAVIFDNILIWLGLYYSIYKMKKIYFWFIH